MNVSYKSEHWLTLYEFRNYSSIKRKQQRNTSFKWYLKDIKPMDSNKFLYSTKKH